MQSPCPLYPQNNHPQPRDLHPRLLERTERPLLEAVLAHTDGNQLRAAALLGINRNTLRKKITELGIDMPERSDGVRDRAGSTCSCDDDPRWPRDPVEQARAALAGGARVVQLRAKHATDRAGARVGRRRSARSRASTARSSS